MLYLNMPPTKDRYIAEIKNLLCINARPFCIQGAPRVHASRLCRILHGVKVDKNSFLVGSTLIIVLKDGTFLEKH